MFAPEGIQEKVLCTQTLVQRNEKLLPKGNISPEASTKYTRKIGFGIRTKPRSVRNMNKNFIMKLENVKLEKQPFFKNMHRT